MGSIKNKLTYLNETKQQLKDVINYADGGIISDTPFRQYPDKLYNQYIEILKDKNVLFDGMPKKEINNTSIYINNATDLPVYELKVNKESTQDTTSGKNLLNISNISTTQYGITCQSDEKGLISVSGTSTSSIGFYLALSSSVSLDDKNYVFSAYADGAELELNVAAVRLLKTNNASASNSFGQTYKALRKNETVSISSNTENGNEYNYLYLFINSNKTVNFNVYFQLEEGNEPTSFEKYTGGQPSPNPDYPVEVETVKGYRNLLNWELPYNVQSAGNIILNDVPQIEIGKSYRFVGKCSDGTILSYVNCSCVWYTGSTQILNKAPNNTFKGIDVSNATGFYIYATSAIVGKTISEFMLVEWTSNNIKNLPYVPYGTNWIFTTISGKNLLHNELISQTSENTTYTRNSDGSITITGSKTGTSETYTTIAQKTGIELGLKENTNYYLSNYGNDTNHYFCIQVYEYYDNNWHFINATYNSYQVQFSITDPNHTIWIRLRTIATFSNINLTIYPMIRLTSTTDNTYEPYKKSIIPIPLNNNEIVGIGDYKDELIVDKNGKCWLNKKTGKVVLDGSDNITIYKNINETDNNYLYYFRPTDRMVNTNVLSNKLLYKSLNLINGNNDLNRVGLSYASSATVYFNIGYYLSENTLIAVSNYLSTNNITFYYVLATPQLIDLNYIVDLTLFEGINNISNSEDGNMVLQYVPNKIE